MIDAYLKAAEERKALGIPPKPLDPQQTREVCALLEKPPAGREELLVALLRDRVPPGVDPAAKVKAEFLGEVAAGNKTSPLVSRKEAVKLLGTMYGGYNVPPLVRALADAELAGEAARALSHTTQVYDALDEVAALSATQPAARRAPGGSPRGRESPSWSG